MEVLRKTEKAIMIPICGVKLIKKRRRQTVLSLLGLKDTLNRLARASGVQWYGHVLRKTLVFEVAGRRKRSRPNMTWKRQVEERVDQIGLKNEDAFHRKRWFDGV